MAKLMCGKITGICWDLAVMNFHSSKSNNIYGMMSHAFCKGFWSKDSHIMCGKTYVKKIVFHSQKSALGRYGSVCSVKLSNRFYNCFGITCVFKPQQRKNEKNIWRKSL